MYVKIFEKKYTDKFALLYNLKKFDYLPYLKLSDNLENQTINLIYIVFSKEKNKGTKNIAFDDKKIFTVIMTTRKQLNYSLKVKIDEKYFNERLEDKKEAIDIKTKIAEMMSKIENIDNNMKTMKNDTEEIKNFIRNPKH